MSTTAWAKFTFQSYSTTENLTWQQKDSMGLSLKTTYIKCKKLRKAENEKKGAVGDFTLPNYLHGIHFSWPYLSSPSQQVLLPLSINGHEYSTPSPDPALTLRPRTPSPNSFTCHFDTVPTTKPTKLRVKEPSRNGRVECDQLNYECILAT